MGWGRPTRPGGPTVGSVARNSCAIIGWLLLFWIFTIYLYIYLTLFCYFLFLKIFIEKEYFRGSPSGCDWLQGFGSWVSWVLWGPVQATQNRFIFLSQIGIAWSSFILSWNWNCVTHQYSHFHLRGSSSSSSSSSSYYYYYYYYYYWIVLLPGSVWIRG